MQFAHHNFRFKLKSSLVFDNMQSSTLYVIMKINQIQPDRMDKRIFFLCCILCLNQNYLCCCATLQPSCDPIESPHLETCREPLTTRNSGRGSGVLGNKRNEPPSGIPGRTGQMWPAGHSLPTRYSCILQTSN